MYTFVTGSQEENSGFDREYIATGSDVVHTLEQRVAKNDYIRER